MCGRYASFRQAQDLADAFARQGFIQDVLFADGTHEWEPAFNVAPTHDIRIIVDRPVNASGLETFVFADGSPASEHLDEEFPQSLSDELVRQVRRARWGLVPSWAKDPSIGSRMINARSETITDKPSFRKAFSSRRCIIPADGYFEWHTEPGPPKTKTPHFIFPQSGELCAFAGIYEFWKNPEASDDAPDRWLVTASIITKAATTKELASIHDRQPVFLDPKYFDSWLDSQTSAEEALAIIESTSVPMTHYVVDTAVNKVANQGPHLIQPL